MTMMMMRIMTILELFHTKSIPAVKVWMRDSVKVGVKFDRWVDFRVPQNVFFFDGRGQNVVWGLY